MELISTSKRYVLAITLVLLICKELEAQVYLLSKSKIDSMLQEPDDRTLFDNYYRLNFYYADRNIDSARLMLKNLSELTNNKFSNQPDKLAILNDTKAYHFYIDGKYDSVAKYLYLSIEQHKQAGNLSAVASSYSNLGNLAYDSYHLDSAESLWLKSLDSFIKLGDSSSIGSPLMNLGAVSFEKGDHIKATQYKYRALEAFTKSNNHSKTVSILMSIAEDKMIYKEYEESKILFDRAFNIASTNNDLDAMRDVFSYYSELSKIKNDLDSVLYYDSMAYKLSVDLGEVRKTLNDRQDLASSYMINGHIQKAVMLCELSLKEVNDSDEPKEYKRYLRNRIYLLLSHIFIQEGNRRDAMRYFSLIDFNINDNFYTRIIESQLRDLYEVSKRLGQFESSLEYHEILKTHQDSMLQIANTWAISEIETKYETTQKEQEIISLQQTADIQQFKLKKQMDYGIIAALIIIVLGILGFSYHHQKKAKMDRVAIELEQRFLRSQLSPHFIFNSMSAIQQYLITESPKKAIDYLSMFSQLMRQILENSREEFITIEEEIKMLQNYLELQKIRFKDAFDYHVIVDEGLDKEYDGIPPMFAQPFIENALEHGLFKRTENLITIKFSKETDDLIRLEILDSGIGITGNLNTSKHKSLASKITNERLEKMRLTYKTEFLYQAENMTDNDHEIHGFKVRLILPSKLVVA